MLSLPLMYLAAGLALSTPVVSDIIDIQKDSLSVTSQDTLPGLYVSNDQRVGDISQVVGIRQPGHRPDSIKPVSQRPVASKKSLTVVKNSSEIDLPDLIDPNPLLTEIMSYDPMRYRVWPRDPKFFYGENLADIVKAEPLCLPLVFTLHQPDYSLPDGQVADTSRFLFTHYTDSLMNAFSNSYESLLANKQFLRKLESGMIKNVQYVREQLPEVDPMVFFLQGEGPQFLEKPSFTFKNNTSNNNSNYPRVSYNPWSARGNFKLNFSETFLSSNWSKGGESNMAGMAVLYLEANYNDLKNIQFDNNLEMKIGLNTVSTDTLRNMNVSTDQLRIVSKLGVKMRDNWYYSLSSEFVTQTLNNYRKNTMRLLSSFMSPAKLFVSLGVDYKKTDKKKGYNLSVMLSPITYKANYLHDNVNLNPKSYGIDPGKHFGSEIGSKVSSTITWKFSEKLNWKSKIYYFSDYTYVDSEWENTFDVSLNNYFSTQLYLYAKMDDRLKRKPGESLIQLQQLLSFGITYRF